MYINKTIAEKTAEKMLENVQAKINNKSNELKQFCQDLVINSYDKKEYEIACSLPDGWIEKKSSFYFKTDYGHGVHESTLNQIICKTYRQIEISKDNYESMLSVRKDIAKMHEKKNALKDQIIESILKLRTSEKIKKEFPEAFKCLPDEAKQESKVVALPFDKILASIEVFPD